MRLLSRFGLGFIKVIGLFPWWVLHVKSNVWAFLIGSVFRYRRKVVEKNLVRVGAEGVSLRGVYLNLTDLAFESAKLFSVNPSSLHSRLEYENSEILESLFQKGKHVVLAGGHIANWEMFSLSLPLVVKYKTIAIYKKLNNSIFDKAIIKSRSRAGMKIIEMNEMAKWIDNGLNNGPVLCSMIFDQSPRNPNKAYWTNFLGVETAVYAGIEKVAQRMDAAVVYAAIKRTGRGKYKMRFSLLEEEASKIERGEIIDKCCSELEREIMNCPESWLWTHRRWKHRRPSNVKLHERKITKFGKKC
jgi:KDO2-lipid IV(A) lauroyltransferase